MDYTLYFKRHDNLQMFELYTTRIKVDNFIPIEYFSIITNFINDRLKNTDYLEIHINCKFIPMQFIDTRANMCELYFDIKLSTVCDKDNIVLLSDILIKGDYCEN